MRVLSPDEISLIREMTAQGHYMTRVAEALHMDVRWLKQAATRQGVSLRDKAAEKAFADEWMRRWYTTSIPITQLVEKYRKEVDPDGTERKLYNRASALKLMRDTAVVNAARKLGPARHRHQLRLERIERMRPVQACFDRGMTVYEAMHATGVPDKTIGRALRAGILTMRSVSEAPRRATTMQSVEEWLAAGNRVTHCPPAAVAVTQARLPPTSSTELRAYREAQDAMNQEGNRWKAKRKAMFAAARGGRLPGG